MLIPLPELVLVDVSLAKMCLITSTRSLLVQLLPHQPQHLHRSPLQQAPHRLPLLLKLLHLWFAPASATTWCRCRRFVNSLAHT